MRRPMFLITFAVAHVLASTLASQALFVKAHIPAANATNVPNHSLISLYFNRAIVDTAKWRMIKVYGEWQGSYSFAPNWSDGNRQLELIPARKFLAGERVACILPRFFFVAQGDSSGKGYAFDFWTNFAKAPKAFGRKKTIKLDSLESPIALAVGDINHDHQFDFAIGNNGLPPGGKPVPISILSSARTGDLEYDIQHRIGGKIPCCLLLGSFNEDTRPDLAVIDFYSDSLHLFINDGAGFIRGESYLTADRPIWLAKSDLDLDGDTDLIVTAISGGSEIFINDGAGKFTKGMQLGSNLNAHFVAAADMDNDGYPDVAMAEYRQATSTYMVSVFYNNGLGQFNESRGVPIGDISFILSLADLNQDRFVDILAVESFDSGVEVLINNRDRSFTSRFFIPVPGRFPAFLGWSDFNDDGLIDIACAVGGTTSEPDSAVVFYLNKGNGDFKQATQLIVGREPKDLVFADLNNDDITDLAVIANQDQTLNIFLGDNTSSVDEGDNLPPSDFGLIQAYPNPFSAETTLSFFATVSAVSLEIYDVLGRQVLSQKIAPSRAEITQWQWNGRDQLGNLVQNGVYLVRLAAGKQATTGKVLVLR